MSDHRAPGERTAMRLMARGEGLQRKETPDGGEVYTGALARHALRAMGARAMTMDKTIIVDESFDLSNPEDQALYAHERHHQLNSGGDGAEGERDSEEVAARAIERMVLHRSAQGEDFGTILRDTAKMGAHDAKAEDSNPSSSSSSPREPEDELVSAYQSMMATGKSHQDVVLELARYVVREMAASAEMSSWRAIGRAF